MYFIGLTVDFREVCMYSFINRFENFTFFDYLLASKTYGICTVLVRSTFTVLSRKNLLFFYTLALNLKENVGFKAKNTI
jgi:hypothetical protein